jgi:hypothetical protein
MGDYNRARARPRTRKKVLESPREFTFCAFGSWRLIAYRAPNESSTRTIDRGPWLVLGVVF